MAIFGALGKAYIYTCNIYFRPTLDNTVSEIKNSILCKDVFVCLPQEAS